MICTHLLTRKERRETWERTKSKNSVWTVLQIVRCSYMTRNVNHGREERRSMFAYMWDAAATLEREGREWIHRRFSWTSESIERSVTPLSLSLFRFLLSFDLFLSRIHSLVFLPLFPLTFYPSWKRERLCHAWQPKSTLEDSKQRTSPAIFFTDFFLLHSVFTGNYCDNVKDDILRREETGVLYDNQE